MINTTVVSEQDHAKAEGAPPTQAGVPVRAEGFLLTPAQVAERLQVSTAWVRDHSTRKHPRLPVVRIGGLLRYDPADIDRWIAEQRAEGLRRAS